MGARDLSAARTSVQITVPGEWDRKYSLSYLYECYIGNGLGTDLSGMLSGDPKARRAVTPQQRRRFVNILFSENPVLKSITRFVTVLAR